MIFVNHKVSICGVEAGETKLEFKQIVCSSSDPGLSGCVCCDLQEHGCGVPPPTGQGRIPDGVDSHALHDWRGVGKLGKPTRELLF